ncbi:IS200/IS605 family transposase [Roseimicrobium sp. ORNL1]|uniref:IS200/IS605 family transposase n=1 Tax=Roseimicrobium sp. ORNL1 TaxID=2711231 RepID=UPI0013E1441B|nr:IS200/IS605 family transposase [Roseimicrobium sp. ORNL1]QIF04899.1 IS200/IS605 family transposase [Roseimicrobium sp. ORNL1]
MAQSLAKVYLHLIFSTKDRVKVLPDDIRPALHDYMGGVLREADCSSVEINTEPDHAHVLFLLSRTTTISNVVRDLKKGSTNWLRAQYTQLRDFYWQHGYGAFSVSSSNVDAVSEYIRNQREHHQKQSFQDEFRAFLKRHDVEFDERYVWD